MLLRELGLTAHRRRIKLLKVRIFLKSVRVKEIETVKFEILIYLLYLIFIYIMIAGL